MSIRKKIFYADDDYESVGTLLKLRTPSLVLGLFLGLGISFVTSNFEAVLATDVQIAFFMPFIVYIADAIGTQTQAIYSRDLKTGKADFFHYLRKETMIGIVLGLAFSAVAGGITFIWLENDLVALSIFVSTFIVVAIAPVMSLLITQTFQSIGKDPATGSGPIATVIQDMTSVVIYGLVCSLIIL